MGADRGFSLVEVVIVMAVLSFGVLGVLQTTLLAARLEQRAAAVTTGTLLAQESLERIGALGWDRETAGLERTALPGAIGMGGEWPQREIARPGARFLLVYERETAAVAAPRCTVHCFWELAGGGFDQRQAVRLSVRSLR